MKEKDLFPIIKSLYKDKGYVVFAEVAHYLRGIDLVAINEEEHIAVELKLSFNDHLIRQAGWATVSFDKVYIAYPVKKPILFHNDEVYWGLRESIRERYNRCKERGIGIYQILPNGNVFEALEATKQEFFRRMDLSHYKENDEDEGGLPHQKGVSAGYHELESIKDYVREHPNASWREIFDNIHTHYIDHKSLSGSMRQWRGFLLNEFKKNILLAEIPPIP